MKTDKKHTEEIAYAVRATRSAVYRELGLTGQEIADRIGTTRQGAAKKSPVTRITPIIPAQLALYDYETRADSAKRKRIVMLLNAKIKDSRYRFSLTEPDPFTANWWRCFAAETKFSLLEFDVLCQKCIVMLDPFFARNDYFKEAIQPLEDALLRAGKNAWVPKSLYTMLQEAPSRDLVYEQCGGISNDEVRDRLYEMGRRDLLGVLSIESNGKVQEDFIGEMLYYSSDRQLVFVTDDSHLARQVMAANRLRKKRNRNAMQIRVLGFDNPRSDDISEGISIEECYSEWTRKTLDADASDVEDGFARLREDAEFSLMLEKRVIEADNRERALKAQGGNNYDNKQLSGT